MFYLFYLYSFTYAGVQYELHITWYSCHLTVTRRVPLGEQELLTLPEHLGFLVGPCCSSLGSSVLCGLFCLSSSCVLCSQCCKILWMFHSGFLLRFSLAFIYKIHKLLSIDMHLGSPSEYWYDLCCSTHFA